MPQNSLHLLNHSVLSLLAAVYWLPCPSGSFHFVSEPRSWENARSYCREKYSDLAAPENMVEMSRLQQVLETKTTYHGDVWIGLKGGSQERWLWSGSGNTSQFTNWQPREPSGNGFCTANDKNGWYDYPCTTWWYFMCHDENSSPKYVMVSSGKTWIEAQRYCREHYTDLVSIESPEDELLFQEIGEGHPIWTGLFKDSWDWVNDGSSSFRHWGSEEEMASNGEDCAAVRTTDEGRWYRHMCSVALPFVCQQSIKQQIFRLVVSNKEHVHLNDPNMKALILQQAHAKLKDRGVSADAKLQWLERGDGKVFANDNSKA